MKRLVMVCLFAGPLGSCAGPDLREAQEAIDWGPQISEANEILLNQGNVDMVPQFFAAFYVSHAPVGDVQGREEIAGFVAELLEAFPDLRVEIEVLVTEGDRVAWLRRAQGTHEGDYRGIPATGRFVQWQDMLVTRFADGLITEEWGVSGLFASLGQP